MIIATSALFMIALEYLVFRTKLGTAMRAVSYDIDAASLMGVPVDRVISFTFVLGSVLAAAAGFLYAMKYPGLNQPAHATWVLLGLKAFVAAVIGGIGNVRGAVLGGFVIALVEQFGSFYLSSNYRDVYVFALLIVILLVRPSGLLGSPCRRRYDRGRRQKRRRPSTGPSAERSAPLGRSFAAVGRLVGVCSRRAAFPAARSLGRIHEDCDGLSASR